MSEGVGGFDVGADSDSGGSYSASDTSSGGGKVKSPTDSFTGMGLKASFYSSGFRSGNIKTFLGTAQSVKKVPLQARHRAIQMGASGPDMPSMQSEEPQSQPFASQDSPGYPTASNDAATYSNGMEKISHSLKGEGLDSLQNVDTSGLSLCGLACGLVKGRAGAGPSSTLRARSGTSKLSIATDRLRGTSLGAERRFGESIVQPRGRQQGAHRGRAGIDEGLVP